MYNDLPLNAFMEEYMRKAIGKKELEERIFTYVLENGERFNLRNWEQEEVIDFLCGIYPRISQSIDRYNYTGASFDAYIGTMIRWSAKERRIRDKSHQLIEESYWNSWAVEMDAYEQEVEYFEEEEPKEPFKPISNPRQALVLLLKSYNYVSDNFIARAAPAIGIPKETLARMVDNIRQRRLTRDEEGRVMRERVQRQYYRCLAFEKRLEAAAPSSAAYIKLQQRLENARRHLSSMRKRLKHFRADASNRLVAEVLGVPKGTVDSNLSAVKTRRYKNN
jgi:hypothetical protein